MKIKSVTLSLLFAFSGVSMVAMGPTYYGTLGVDKDATLETIEKAYRNAARENHPDKNASDFATKRMQSINEAYNVLKDEKARQEYDQQAAGNAHFAAADNVQNNAQDQIMLLAGIAGAKRTYSYVTHAWNTYAMHKNFLAVKKHAELQLKNIRENKKITPMRNVLDLSWVAQFRKEGQPSAIEQEIVQFDRLAMQNPQSLPAAAPQLIKTMDKCCNAIGDGKTSLFKAAAMVGFGTIGYFTYDKWLPQLLASKWLNIALRLFS